MPTSDMRELKRLFEELQRSGSRQYKAHLGYLYDLLRRTARFWSILELLRSSAEGFDVDEWIGTKVFVAKATCHEWPASENERLRVLLRLIERCATDEKLDPASVGRRFIYGRNMDEGAQAVTVHVVLPLVMYLQNRLGTDSEVLYQLERMRRQIEWFEQQALYERFVADTGRGEEAYDRRVREFLFAQGIDYPFSQPASVSGKIDVIAGLETEDPLVCEIKLYNGDHYGASYLRQGVQQAVRYAKDYAKVTAHLVIFNLSSDRLELPSDSAPDQQPPRIVVEGVTVFLVVVQAKPLPSASKDRGREVRSLQRDQLVPVGAHA